MTSHRPLPETGTHAPGTHAAAVLSLLADGRALVAVDPGPAGEVAATAAAEVAEHVAPLAPGDRVVTAGDPAARLFVIARLAPAIPAPSPAAGAVQTVTDADGRPLVTVDPLSRAVTVHAAAGDLALAAPAGRVTIAARDGIVLEGGPEVRLEAARVGVTGGTVAMAAGEVAMVARRGRLTLERLVTGLGSVRHVVESLLVEAGRVGERVRGKREIAARSVRVRAEESVDIAAETVDARASGDVVIDGDRIHLG